MSPVHSLPTILIASLLALLPDGAKAADTAAKPPVKIILVGDSTVTDQAGWGLGFKQFLTGGAQCTNTAMGGRSSMSFRQEGRWEKALALHGDYYLIQFGHNNESGKPGRSTDMPTFVADMTHYVDEARAAGAKPILVTPLVRRQFDKADDHKINSSLAPYAEEVRKIAAAKGVPLVDLHARSQALCERLGRVGCLAFSPLKTVDGKSVPDGTHLDAKGSVLFARLVVEELRRVAPELGAVLRAEPVATGDIEPRGAADPIAPIQAPFAMPQLARPVFPDRVVDIRDHGAIEGGAVKNTAAFAAAIKACADAGGGRVLVPAGKWLTGPIHLQSSIDLHLAQGAEVIFSDQFDDYLPNVLVRVGGIELYNYSPLVYAHGCENIAITGPGRLNGNAQAWWGWQKKETKAFFDQGARGVPVEQRVFGTPEAAIRPSFVSFIGCKNVLLEGFTIGGGPNWTIHPIYCENLIVRRVTVDTDGPNNDGIDPDSCRNVLIEHCTFSTGDDCVVLKSGYNEDGWRVGRPTENVVMRWCTSRRGHGGLVVGSEMSGDVRNVYMHDCGFEGTDRAVRIKSRRGRGGIVENVWAENLTAKDMKYEVVILNMDYSSDTKQLTNEKAPLFRNMTFRHITGAGAPAAIRLTGLPDSPIQNIRFEDLTIASTKGVICSDVKGLVFDRVQVTPASGPVFALKNASDLVVRGARAPAGTDVFLQIEGQGTSGVRLEACDLSAAKQPFVTGPGVPAGAVTLK
ncbi:MAG TPA: glycosyl hydrolase family 28 protein [Opitutaceae bacterium]|nr:glycosyl hydrolase family 28 protein [Opitutaceae bacterium]